MSRPDLVLTPEESARLNGDEWKVPSHAVSYTRKNKRKGTETEVKRWAEVGIVTEAMIDQNEEGIIKGRIGLLISDQDHHRNENPRHRLTVWITMNPAMAKAEKPEPDSPDWGPWWGTSLTKQKLESFLKALGETGVLTGRKYLRDFGALYDFFKNTDLSGREVLVNLEYPPSYENQLEPDVRYFEVAG